MLCVTAQDNILPPMVPGPIFLINIMIWPPTSLSSTLCISQFSCQKIQLMLLSSGPKLSCPLIYQSTSEWEANKLCQEAILFKKQKFAKIKRKGDLRFYNTLSENNPCHSTFQTQITLLLLFPPTQFSSKMSINSRRGIWRRSKQ